MHVDCICRCISRYYDNVATAVLITKVDNTKELIPSRKSKDRHHNVQKKEKSTTNDLQNITQKAKKNRATPIQQQRWTFSHLLRKGLESSCSTYHIRLLLINAKGMLVYLKSWVSTVTRVTQIYEIKIIKTSLNISKE